MLVQLGFGDQITFYTAQVTLQGILTYRGHQVLQIAQIEHSVEIGLDFSFGVLLAATELLAQHSHLPSYQILLVVFTDFRHPHHLLVVQVNA